MFRHFAIACLAVLLLPAAAQAFEPVRDKSEFTRLIAGQTLNRLGVQLVVTPEGAIRGNAFGQKVTGAWNWSSGYFCRDLAWGSRSFGANCQLVEVAGNRLRFTSDRGTGDTAVLTLK